MLAASGRLVAYTFEGDPIWIGDDGGPSYSSPQRLELAHDTRTSPVDHAVEPLAHHLVHLNSLGALSLDPRSGRELWRYSWPGQAIVQPALVDGDVLVSAGEGKGLRRLQIRPSAHGWTVAESWSSNRLKPNFSDFVVHQGVAFGFDGSILAALDLSDGERLWKRGRYGHGQVLLLSDQELLLVTTERGELVLVGASRDDFRELGLIRVLDSKSWNHPALASRVLLMRGGDQLAAVQLPQPR